MVFHLLTPTLHCPAGVGQSDAGVSPTHYGIPSWLDIKSSLSISFLLFYLSDGYEIY